MDTSTLIDSGRTADVHAWGEHDILKLYQGWMPAVAVEREFTVTRLARQAGLPVPEAKEIVKVDGRLGIVFERIRGVSLLKILETHPGEVFKVAGLLAELHAGMHACSLPPDSYTQRQQVERGIEMALDLSETARQTIHDLLVNLREGEAVCHGDFHPGNVLMTDHGPVIIDWMTGTRGHPLGDVARTILLLQAGGLPPGVPLSMRILINLSRRLITSQYVKRYLQMHPASRKELRAWEVPLLAARLFEVENYPAEKMLILRRLQAPSAKVEK